MSSARKLSLFLAEYNLWRRGRLDEMPSSHTPAEIGVALDEAVYLLKKYDELERDELLKLRAELDCSCNAEELRQVRADKTEALGKLAQVERENEKLRAELWSARRQLDDSMRPSHEDLEGAFEWLRKNAPVSIRYMTGNDQWSLPPAYCVLVKDRLFYGTTVFHAVREAMLSKP